MAERNGRVEITAEIDQRLQSALSQMSSSLRSTIEVTNAVNRSTDLTKSTMRGLSQALSVTSGSTNEYNRSVTEAVKNQAILASHFGKTKEAITSLNKIMANSRGTNVTSQDIAAQRAFINQLQSQLGIQKELQKYSNTQSLMAQSNALNSLATKYSYAGNRLSMGLTLPLVGFFRTAFSNYRRLEIETVRTTKLLGDSYTDAGAQVKTLGKELDAISLKYGVARDLVQGLAGDYAELGITDIKALAGLTDLTAATEKLGNVDITEASNFIKSIYQTVNRVKRDEAARAGRAISFKDPAEEALFYADSIAQVRGQLAMFNLLENKTSLALQDIAKAFPELTAASTSFGLSMTEASALIIPMVASGFQVGASANSVKVSLQRLVAMTKKNQEAIKALKLTQADFNFEAGVGIDTIQKLSDGYESLKKTRGDEGALRFFSDLFGVRQGPRMEVALQNLSQFQSQISKAGTIEDQLTTQLESYVRQRAGQAGLGEKYSKMELTKYSDLSKVIRLSQNADKEVASAFTSARSDFGNYLVSESKRGQDLLGKVTTETGRALFAAASGGGKGSQAEATFNLELEKALDTADRRYRTSRESIKALGREMVPVFDSILKVVVPLLEKFAKFVGGIPSGFKAFLTIGGLVLAMLGPIMKIRGAFAQLHSSVLSFKASGGIFKNLRSSIHPISAELLASSDAFLKFKNKLVQVGNQFFFKGTIKELKQMEKLIAAQSSGRTATASRLEKKLKLKKEADYSGLYEETSTQLKNVFDESLNGYLKPYTGIKPDITGTIIDGRVVGLEMGNAFVSVLTSLGFDPRAFTRVASTAGSATTTTTPAGDVVVPPNIKRTGSRTPPPDDDGPDGGPSGGSPTGGSPTGGAPAGGGAAQRGPRVRNPMSGLEQVWGALQETMDFVNSATKSQLQDFAKSLNITKVSGFTVKSPKLKVAQLRRAIIEAISAPSQILAKAAEDIQTTAEQVKEVVNNNAPPATDTSEVEQASTKATENVAEAQAEVDTVAVKEQGKEDEKATKETKPKTGRKGPVKKASEKAVDNVAAEQAKADAKAAEEQGKADATVVRSGPRTIKARLKRKPFLKVDKNLEGTIGAFSHLTSTINEMVANAQQVQKISVEEAIAKLNLGIEGSKKLRFTPTDFTRLAELMGVILPQAFYEIQEFTNKAGKPLQIQADSLQNIINAIAEIVPASEALPELAGKRVLRIEEDLNRAFIALEKQGGTKAFNIGNAVGTLRHTLNEAINMMIPKENLKVGQVVPLEEITYKDIKGSGRRSKSRVKKRHAELVKTAQERFGRTMTEEALTESYGPADSGVTEGNVRIVEALSFGRAKGRGSRSLFRRELDLKNTLDSLTEEAYNTHRAKIEKGISEARSRMEAIKSLSDSGFDIETDNLSLDELRQAYKDLEREMREGSLNEPIDKVIEKLRGQAEIISKNRNRPGRLTSDSGDVIFDLPKMLDERLQKAKDALKFEYGDDPIPENRIKASTRAVFVQMAKDLQYAYMEQLAKFQKEIDKTIPEVSRKLSIAEENVETARGKLKDVKALKVGSEEGKEYFKGRKKTDVVESLQKELSLLEEQRDIIKAQYEELVKKNKADQQNIASLARVRDEQLAILNIKRQEYGLTSTTISAPAVEDTSPTGSERAKAYWQSVLDSRAQELKRQQEDAKTRTPDAISTAVVTAATQLADDVLAAQDVVNAAKQRLDDLVGLKTDISMSEPGKPFAANAQARVKEAVKNLKVKASNIDKEIVKQEKVLEEAKTALNQISERSRAGGGGRSGSVNLGMPMAGGFGDPMSTDLSPRGGRRSPLDMMTPRNIMSMIPSGGDLIPDLSGVRETLLNQISQAIGAPAEVMAGVVNELETRAKKVFAVVNTSLDQFDNEVVNKLITQIQGLLGDSELTVENIYLAIRGARTQIYGMVPKEIKGNVISGKATAEQVTGLVEALNLYNVSKEELLKLDARTLRKIAEKMKLEGRAKAGVDVLAGLIHNAIFNLDKETINAIDLVALMPVVEAGSTVKTTAQKAPKPTAAKKVKEAVEDLIETTAVVVNDVAVDTTVVVESVKTSLQELMALSPYIQKYGISVQDIADVSRFVKQAIANASSLTLRGANEAFATLKTIKNDSALTSIFLQEYGIDVASAIEDIRIVMQQRRKELVDSARTAVDAASSAVSRPRNAVDEAMERVDAARRGTPVSVRTGQSVVDYRAQDKFLTSLVKIMDASLSAGKAVGSLYLSVMRAGTMMLPFGRTMWNIGSGFVSLTQSAIALYKSSKEAGTGLKGVSKTLGEIAKAKILGGTYTNAKGEQVQSGGVLGSLGKTGASIKQAFSGAAGTGIQGLINTATMGMGQFGFVAGNVLQNLTSALQSIPYIGGPVVGILGAITGSIYLLIKSSKVWKGTNEEAFQNFKDAWQNIKDILSAIAGPFEDFIGTLLGAPEAGANATDSAKTKLLTFSNFILNLSNKVESFVKNYIVPAIRRTLQIVVYLFNAIKPFASATVGLIVAIFNQITNKQADMVKKAGELFKGGTQAASAGNLRMVDNAIRNVESVEDAWVTFKNSFKDLWEAIVKVFQYYLSIIYLRAYMFLNLAMAEILQGLVSLFFEGGKQMGQALQNGIASKVKRLGNMTRFGLGSSLSNVLKGAGWLLEKTAGGGQGVSNNFFDDAQTDITNKFNRMIRAIEDSGQGKAAFDSLLESLMPEGSGSGLFKSFKNLLTKVFKDPTAANAAADSFKEAVNSALSNLKENFFNAALSGLGDAISKIKSEVSDILNAQKEEYLQAYDDQIAAIDAMAEAEQRLTATEEYEANKRQRIKDRELQRQNYQKNRSLAIYEGRIDDARQLDLEEQKNISDFNKENADAETARGRDLQGNARADAKAVIEKQRLEASKLFDQAIKDFNEYVEIVGKDGTLTEAQLTEQWKKISEEAEKTSKGLYETFKASFESLPGAISAVTGSSSGLFDIPYDKLITEAKKQFGIGNTNADSILGLTRSMLTGQSSAISNAFSPTGAITKAYSDGLEKLKIYIGTKNSGEGEASLKGIFKKIIAEANETAKQEILKGQRGLGSAFAELMGYLNKELSGPNGLALKEIVAKQLRETAELVRNTTITAPTVTAPAAQPPFAVGGPGPAGRGRIVQPSFDAQGNPLNPNFNDVPYSTDNEIGIGAGNWWARYRTNKDAPWRKWTSFPWNKLDTYLTRQRNQPTRWQINYFPSFLPNPNTFSGSNRFNGGAIPYGNGGPTVGPMHQGIPAILHGGEYVVRKSAVDKYGTGMLQNINQGTFGKKGGFFTGGRVRGSSLDVPGLNMGTDPNFNTTRDIIRSQYTNFYSGLQSLSPSRDRALYEWQVSMGGLNYNYMREIWRKEAKSWTNNRTKSGRPTEGSYAGGGLGISYKNWKTWGGLEFADYPFNANPYQQMVVYNRMIALGYKGQYGVKEKAMTAAQRIKKSYDGKLAAFHFGSKELYDNDAFVNEYTPSNPAKKGQDKTYNSIIVSEKDGVGYTTTGSAGVREFFPISRLRDKKGKRFVDARSSFYRPFSLFKGGSVDLSKPPKPYKAWAEYFAANPSKNTPTEAFVNPGQKATGLAKSKVKDRFSKEYKTPLVNIKPRSFLPDRLDLRGMQGQDRLSATGSDLVNALLMAIPGGVVTKPIGAAAKALGISGIASKIGAKILPRTASGVPKVIGKLAGKFGGKISGLGEDYSSGFMGALNLEGIKGTMGIYDRGNRSWLSEILRADNIASRKIGDQNVFEFSKKLLAAAQSKGMGVGEYVKKFNAEYPKKALESGPLTSFYDDLNNIFNPFKQRVGIHIGTKNPGIDTYSQILPGINQFGPGDQQAGMTYSWLRGSIGKVVEKAQGFMGMEGFTGTKGAGALTSEIVEGATAANSKTSNYYITKSIGKLFRDQNIVTSPSMRSAMQEVLEVLPANATKEQLMEALARHRKNAKIKNIFGGVKNLFKSGSNNVISNIFGKNKKFTGGLVNDKKKTSSAANFRKADIASMAKAKNTSKPEEKKSAFWNAMNSIQGGIESAMNFSADTLEEAGKLLVSSVHEPVVRLSESTVNPLAQILRIPGSENLEIATPGTAAYSAIETFLTLFGGKLIVPPVAKIGKAAAEGSSGPIRNVASAARKKFFPDAIETATLLKARKAAEEARNIIPDSIRTPAKLKLSEIVGIEPEKAMLRESYPTEDHFWKAMEIFGNIKVKMIKEAMDTPDYKLASLAIKKIDKAIALPKKIQSGLKFIQNGVIFSEFDDFVGSVVDLTPGLSNKPRNVANIPWAGGLDKIFTAEHYKASPGGMFGKSTKEYTSWYTRPTYETEFGLLDNIENQELTTHPDYSKDIYKDDQGKVYNSIYTSEYYTKNNKPFRASIPELFRAHDNTIITVNRIPKKDFLTRQAYSEAMSIFSKTVGLKAKNIDLSPQTRFDSEIDLLKFLKGKKGFGLELAYDRDPEGSSAWAMPLNYRLTEDMYKKNGLKPRMTAQMAFGFGTFNKILHTLGFAQELFPYNVGNITDLAVQLLSMPLKAIGPGNEGRLSTIGKLGMLTQAKGLANHRGLLKNLFLHELGHVMFLDHTMGSRQVEGFGEQGNSHGAPTAIRSIMSYDAPNYERYLPGDIRGFQSMLKPLPDFSKMPKPKKVKNNKFNGGFIPQFKKGGRLGISCGICGKGFANGGLLRAHQHTSHFNGGILPYAQGGPTFGPEHQGIPATLHGGEYVIRKSSVDKYGRNMLQNINQGIYKRAGQYKIGGYVDGIDVPSIPKFSTPMANYAKIAAPNVSTGTMQSESTHNYNFFVDNFIGETEWFNSMMKEYNMKVVPANQKQAGLESRVIKTYNGINRGM